MKKLWVACLSAWVLICLSTTTVLAQGEEETVPFCGELTAEACAALDAADEAMAELTSGTTETQFEIYLTGGPLGEQELSLQLTTARTFVMAPETSARLVELQTLTSEELAADPAAATEALLLPLAINTSQTTTVAFSPELLALLAARVNADIPASLTFQTRIIDNVLYIRLADYAVFGAQPTWVPEWLGIELTPFMTDTVASAVASPEFDIADAQDALVAPGADMASSEVVYHIRPEQLLAYADFMQLSSLGTSEVEGRTVNIYRLTWDIPRYVGGPLFAQHMGFAAGDRHPSPASLLLGALSSILLHGLQTEVTQAIGVEDGYLYRVQTRVTWDLSLAGGPLLAASPTLGLTSTTTNSDLNNITAIPVPEGAVVPPISLLIQTFRLINR